MMVDPDNNCAPKGKVSPETSVVFVVGDVTCAAAFKSPKVRAKIVKMQIRKDFLLGL